MESVGDEETEAHTRDVEDSLGYDKTHGEEEVGGWEEGEDGETQTKQDLPVVTVSGAGGVAGEGEEAGKGGQGQEVAGVRERGNGGNSAHGILSTQLGGTQ